MRSLGFLLAIVSVASVATEENGDQRSLFEPLDGRILVFGGQSLRDTRNYYALANTPAPGGFSDYFSYSYDSIYFDLYSEKEVERQGGEGLLEPTNWGGGTQCVDCLLKEPGFSPAAINIGLYIGGPEDPDGGVCKGKPECTLARIARGDFDEKLSVFASWLNGLDGRPVFLRTGYEFDGPWNGYPPEEFKAAWKHIHRFLRRAGVTNVAHVFHSYGYASMETLEAYFPEADAHSDSYVDWIGYSHFSIDPEGPGKNELAFARQRGLKVFLGEVAPHGGGDCENQIDITTDTERALLWVDNFFKHVEANRDVIRGLAYINQDWSDASYSPMWKEQDDQNCRGFFYRSNSRLNDSPILEKAWGERISGDAYLNQRDDLYQQLWGTAP